MSLSDQFKSKERISDHGEVFTAEREVKAMCDFVADECLRIDSRFFEPACGDGNFLAEVLTRKLITCQNKYKFPLLRPDYEKASINAIMSIYGVELLPDNVDICRRRLFKIWYDKYLNIYKSSPYKKLCEATYYILTQNILCGNALTMKCDNGHPIIFAEWSFIDSINVKRRDFRLDKLIAVNEQAKTKQIPLGVDGVGYDSNTHEFIPLPLKEYTPIDYRRLGEHG